MRKTFHSEWSQNCESRQFVAFLRERNTPSRLSFANRNLFPTNLQLDLDVRFVTDIALSKRPFRAWYFGNLCGHKPFQTFRGYNTRRPIRHSICKVFTVQIEFLQVFAVPNYFHRICVVVVVLNKSRFTISIKLN